jgi:hypothetical protein
VQANVYPYYITSLWGKTAEGVPHKTIEEKPENLLHARNIAPDKPFYFPA